MGRLGIPPKPSTSALRWVARCYAVVREMEVPPHLFLHVRLRMHSGTGFCPAAGVAGRFIAGHEAMPDKAVRPGLPAPPAGVLLHTMAALRGPDSSFHRVLIASGSHMSVRGGGSRRRGRPPSVSPPPLARRCRVHKMLLLSSLNFVISSPSGVCLCIMIGFHVVGVAVAVLFSLQFLMFRLQLRCLCIHRSLRHWRPPCYILCHGLRLSTVATFGSLYSDLEKEDLHCMHLAAEKEMMF
ncbi:uncharacterized protein LOC124705648 [Lolium rigidum]|uniref:uncharacterized protein LOC124705648 n=1 Tax=Lolium rigidum TaxID=89674 RepID=UPI001F5D0131|nr:uncharacterized protein LOC124705648 [Lolium rigidum]